MKKHSLIDKELSGRLCWFPRGEYRYDKMTTSFNQKKYIGKELPLSFQFKTSRPSNSQIFHFSEKSNNLYIFPLPGEPLSNLFRSRPGQ